MKDLFIQVFEKLNSALETENTVRRESGTKLIPMAKLTLLGQISLIVQPEHTYMLSLAQTGDLDAKIRADNAVKVILKEILPAYGLIYDEDSELVFIPAGSQFFKFLNLSLVEVEVIDPESALVSKAVKAPEKNLQLIRQAIVSGSYPNLADRIAVNGGDLEKFV